MVQIMVRMQMIAIAICLSTTAVSAADGKEIVARVNRTEITSQELDAAVQELIPQLSFHRNLSDERQREFQEEALEKLILAELQHQDAVRTGLKPDPTAVKEELKRIRARYESKKAYREALEAAGINEDQLRFRIEKANLVDQIKRKMVRDPSLVSDAMVAKEYADNREKFKRPESVRLRIITIKDARKARETMALIEAGQDFGSVAARMSEDQYRIKGGDIGYVHRGRVLPEIEDVAFKLKMGQMSSIIPAEKLFFIIKLEDHQKEKQMQFEEVKTKLKSDLEKNRAEKLQEEWENKLRATAKVEKLLPLSNVQTH